MDSLNCFLSSDVSGKWPEVGHSVTEGDEAAFTAAELCSVGKQRKTSAAESSLTRFFLLACVRVESRRTRKVSTRSQFVYPARLLKVTLLLFAFIPTPSPPGCCSSSSSSPPPSPPRGGRGSFTCTRGPFRFHGEVQVRLFEFR